MPEKILGTWRIADSDCTAALDFDWGRSINISLQWSREPGPVEHERLTLILPDIVRSALNYIEKGAALCEGVLEAIAGGLMCRSGIEDEMLTYEAIHPDAQHDALPGEDEI
jgi:hypothetical protein